VFKHWVQKLFSREVILYGIFGVLTTALNIVIFQIALMHGIDYRIANIIALISTKIAAYVVNKLFVFHSHCKDLAGLLKEFGRFIVARGATMAVDYLGLIVLVETLDVDKRIGKYMTTCIVVVINYFFSKGVVFRDIPSGPEIRK